MTVDPKSSAGVCRAEQALAEARSVQPAWAVQPITVRLAVIKALRHELARQAGMLARRVGVIAARPAVDSLAAEVLPLIDACRFLERRAARWLAPKRLGWRARPLWLIGTTARIRREPLGVVLVLAPGNYPLFLAATQAIQALAAGNTVLVKPAPGCREPLDLLAAWLAEAGLPAGAFAVLDEAIETGMAVIEAGVDKVVLTGGAETGRRVLKVLAPHLTPAVMELSGCDAVFVLPGADLDQAAAAIVYGLTLNAGRTCIAPRRLFAEVGQAQVLERLLTERLQRCPVVSLAPAVAARLRSLAADAAEAGCRLLPAAPDFADDRMKPLLISDAKAVLASFDQDIFAPVLALVPVEDMDEALRLAAECPYALGAAVFGPLSEAAAFTAHVKAGAVTVNDLIVPTADPRLPFGGSGKSGFGVTRGGEGLLELTKIKTVSMRKPRAQPYYQPLGDEDAVLFEAYLKLAHGDGLAERLQALVALFSAVARRLSGRAPS